MRIIQLTKNQIAYIDDEDWDKVKDYKWYAVHQGQTYYAIRSTLQGGRSKKLRMHRVIMGITDPAIEVDHEDCNGLNNQRYNLRIATRRQNCTNQRKRFGATSLFKGVHWSKSKQQWRAVIYTPGYKSIGYYNEELIAAKAYDQAAIRYFGVFAKLNFPTPTEEPSLIDPTTGELLGELVVGGPTSQSLAQNP